MEIGNKIKKCYKKGKHSVAEEGLSSKDEEDSDMGLRAAKQG